MTLSNEILSDIGHHMKYAKYIEDKDRRETFEENTTRCMNMHIEEHPELEDEIRDAFEYVYDKKVLPSMRSMQFGGKPIKLNPARLYNCSYVSIDHPYAFPEAMFLLLGGTGVGYSVQKQHIRDLPKIRKPRQPKRYLVGDSIEGWADAVKTLIKAYFYGDHLPQFDYRDIRPKGAKLMTAGGKAPGPEPLRNCINQLYEILDSKPIGSQLKPIEAHDMMCIIADAVLAGGIRRAALICGFSIDDEEMMNSKGYYDADLIEYGHRNNGSHNIIVELDGEQHHLNVSDSDYERFNDTGELPWYHFYPWRARANNSAVAVRSLIDKDTFMDVWKKTEEGNSGEPGIYFTNNPDWFTNPCAS